MLTINESISIKQTENVEVKKQKLRQTMYRTWKETKNERNHRLSTRLKAPKITPISSRGGGRFCKTLPFSLLSSSLSPSMARRSIAFRASRSSNRPAQMRRTRDDTRSDMDRYSSISWTPAAKVSSVGASPLVMRERRDATADGGIGGSGVAEVDDSGSGCVVPGCNDANSFCCEGSKSERSILSVLDVEDSGCDGAGCCASDPLDIGGLIRGTDGGRRSAFSECLSRCNLDFLVLALVVHPNRR